MEKPEKIKTFSELRTEWLRCIGSKDDDYLSIYRQISDMMWNEAAYNIVRQIYHLAPKAKKGGIQLNPLMFGLIDTTYAQSQLFAIRRIVDLKGTLYGENGVYSLGALLNDMKKNCSLFTRDNMIRAEGLKDDSATAKIRQGCFDKLTDTNPGNRSPDDVIHPKVFEKLRNILFDKYKDVKTYVNQYLAHAASPESREIKESEKIQITGDYLQLAQKTICQIANLITDLLEGVELRFLPSVNSRRNLFHYIEHPLVNEKDIPVFEKAWSDYETETRNWGSLPLNELDLDDEVESAIENR